jgi:hypothetical protein
MTGSDERGNEPLDFLKGEALLGKLSAYRQLKKSCAALSWLSFQDTAEQ